MTAWPALRHYDGFGTKAIHNVLIDANGNTPRVPATKCPL